MAGKGLVLPRGGNHVVFLELWRDSARESWGWRSSHCRAEETSPKRVSAHRPLLGSVHFLLLVFLKVPLLLGMLGAVLWVNRPLRSSGGKPQENQQPPCSSTFPEQKTLEQKKKAFFSGNDSGQWRLWFSRQRGPLLQESVP